ncbi:neuralized-like protein 4 [Glandiceps talaboti]
MAEDFGDRLFSLDFGTKKTTTMGNGAGVPSEIPSEIADFFPGNKARTGPGPRPQGQRRDLGTIIAEKLFIETFENPTTEVTVQQRNHGWDPRDCSQSFQVMDDGVTARRLQRTANTGNTEAVRSKKSYQVGVHTFQIHWPQQERGSHAVVGVGSPDVELTLHGYCSLVGSTANSWGWNVCDKTLHHCGKVVGSYPSGGRSIQDTFSMVLDLDVGTLSFKTHDGKDLGTAFRNIPKGDMQLCVMASATAGDCHIQMKYLGSKESSQSTRDWEIFSHPAPTDQTFYTFDYKCGKNAEIMYDGKRARRKDATKCRDNAIVVTSQPLDDNELFEIRLDSKVSGWAGALEVGVTTTSADLYGFPPSLTDCQSGLTFTWSGKHVWRNAKEYLKVGQDLDNVTVGDKIGVKKDGGSLKFYFNGSVVGQEVSLAEFSGSLYGAVSIDGETEQVTIMAPERCLSRMSTARPHKEVAATTTPISIMMGMRSTIDTLREMRLEPAVIAVEINTTIVKPYIDRRSDKTTKLQYGDHLADLGAAEEFTQIIKRFSKPIDKMTEDAWKAIEVVRLACWNYSDASLKLAAQLGRAGLLVILLNELDKFGIPKTRDEKLRFMVLSTLNILHNCAKATENRQIYRDKHALGRVAKFLKSDDREYVMVAALILSFISEDDNMDLVELDTRAAKHILGVLKKALDSKSQYGRADESGYSVLELVQGLGSLAMNRQNQATLMQCGALPVMVMAMNKGGPMEQEHAASIVMRMAQYGEDNRNKIGKDKDVIAALRRLMQSNCIPVYEAAERAMMTIKPTMNFQVLGTAPSGKKTVGRNVREQPNCEYMDLCRRFLASLDIPDGFINSKFNVCYCNNCHVIRGDFFYYTRGEPPMDYGLPIGWSRYGLHVHKQRAGALKIFKEWHVAFHGTTPSAVKHIIETGELLMAGDVAYGGVKLTEGKGHYTEKWKPEGFDTKNIFMSPTIRYAGIDCYSKPDKYTDGETGKTYEVKVAFQVCVRPGSYRIGKQTVGAHFRLDPRFDNQEIEWYTKERGAVILYGVLIKLINTSDPLSCIGY